MKKFLLVLFILSFKITVFSQEVRYEIKSNIPYYSDNLTQSDEYIKEQCVLDIYYPSNTKGFPVIIWFHGGGLTGGNKEIPKALTEKGCCVVGVNYRLYPKINSPKYIEDAAAATAWVFKHIGSFGGDTSLVFLSGHSAGGYLASMIGLDKKWLSCYNVDANKIAGIVSLSGQMITHFTIRKEKGIPDVQPVIDELAPLYHVRSDASPLLLITGDRELELLGRYEENAYMMRMMKLAGHKFTRLYELDGYGHNMTEPAFPLLLNEVSRIIENNQQKLKK